MTQIQTNIFYKNVAKAVLMNIFGISPQKNAHKTLVQLFLLKLKHIGGSEIIHVSKNVQFNITFNKNIN